MKVLALVADCAGCPNRRYYSAGRHECTAAQTGLPYDANGHQGFLPEWCPLTEYPAAAMNRMTTEIGELRKALIEARSPKSA